MFIESLSIKNYRNFNDFSIHFHSGLNVIIGANNSGKTGLISAIRLLDGFPSLSIEDFNKNELLNFKRDNDYRAWCW
jgi:putative ATP-dependent endonuclease of OLD family